MEVNETLSSSFELEARGSLRLDSPAPELEPSVAVLVEASKTWNVPLIEILSPAPASLLLPLTTVDLGPSPYM
ncbi:hypothetical protein TB2_012451 [Malus domestica]